MLVTKMICRPPPYLVESAKLVPADAAKAWCSFNQNALYYQINEESLPTQDIMRKPSLICTYER